jgi:hypothetical protein
MSEDLKTSDLLDSKNAADLFMEWLRDLNDNEDFFTGEDVFARCCIPLDADEVEPLILD